ncbi:hypothetical protein M0811_12834 [Anaeramoeba ignava]|uniref:Uncharacterized protein n=1 Tax=Anaeramoeba ignava TaxID=1746090 RepID=A0A9Q0R660_ANAIG|nr:hypothetical protein M0811_12834 [Anaeramoeba ignava]
MFLLMKNEENNEMKIIIPVRSLSEDFKLFSWNTSNENPNTNYQCFIMKIDENGKILTNNEEENFFISFLYLEHKFYEESIKYLLMIQPILPLSKLSFEIGFWILSQFTNQNLKFRDCHPYASSIRIICAEILYSNYFTKIQSKNLKEDFHNIFHNEMIYSWRTEFQNFESFQTSLAINLNIYLNFGNLFISPKIDYFYHFQRSKFFENIFQKFKFQENIYYLLDSIFKNTFENYDQNLPFPQTFEFIYFESYLSYPQNIPNQLLFSKTELVSKIHQNSNNELSKIFKKVKKSKLIPELKINIKEDFSKLISEFPIYFRSILQRLCDPNSGIKENEELFLNIKVWMKFLNLKTNFNLKLKNIILDYWEKRKNSNSQKFKNPFLTQEEKNEKQKQKEESKSKWNDQKQNGMISLHLFNKK